MGRDARGEGVGGVDEQVGGFGGAEGLARALDDADLLVDATHPFAARISAHARAAAAATGTPLL
ncbi:MAG TPA: precorrin-6A/cobalt-precorrin-6A reductase, partial [Amaricoccus sp.]|nr:precorrin-6A/cobalt-precorrin-6A reductase [Amaricoccus sp.]